MYPCDELCRCAATATQASPLQNPATQASPLQKPRRTPLPHHHDIDILLGLLLAVAGLAWLASRLKVAYPIFLVLGGLGLSFVQRAYPKQFPQIELEPELVFLLFLPPLLYYAGL